MNCPFRHRLPLHPQQQHSVHVHIHIHLRRHGGNDSAVCSDRGGLRDFTLRSTLSAYIQSDESMYSVCIHIHTHHSTYRVLDITPLRILLLLLLFAITLSGIGWCIPVYFRTGFGTIEFPLFSLLPTPTFTFGSFLCLDLRSVDRECLF